MDYLRNCFIVIVVCSSSFAADSHLELFNGKNLEGWVQRGGKASYVVEDGCIVGTATPDTPNSFLCTARDYGDFVLEYEFKVDSRLNSGVQIRSQSLATASELTWEGQKIMIPADRVHGYRIEIDPEPTKDRWWSAGIYDEARRGWLFPGILGGEGKAFSEQGRKLFKRDDWNQVRVEAIGDSIRTTLNGSACASIKDSLTPAGFIALQVHAIDHDNDNQGGQVRWRKLRLQEVPAPPQNTLSAEELAAGWRLLWDGQTPVAWRSAKGPDFPKAGWEILNGELTIHETGGAESAAAGDIITREKFSDFELSVDFKITPGANSGIKIFVDPEINRGEGSAIGPEFQILDDARHPDAKLGRDGNRTIGSLYDMIPAPANKRVNPVGLWNNARILSVGPQVTFWLNGVKTLAFERGSKEWRDQVAASKYRKWPAFGELAAGHILLQDHGNTVTYRNIKIRDFAKK